MQGKCCEAGQSPLLVLVGDSPHGESLVRATKQLAGQLQAEWFAANVDTGRPGEMRPEAAGRRLRNLRMAEELGGKVVTLQGPNVAGPAVRFARRHGVSKIVAGKSEATFWTKLLGRSVVDQLLRTSGGIDVYVINTGAQSEAETSPPPSPQPRWPAYLYAALAVVAVTGLGELIQRSISPTNLVMFYLVAVLAIALYLGRGPALAAAVVSVAVFDFFLIPPRFTLAVQDTEYLITFAALLLTGLVVSGLAARAREQAAAARNRTAQTVAQYELSRDLASVETVPGVAETLASRVAATLGRSVTVVLPPSLHSGAVQQIASGDWVLDEAELARVVSMLGGEQPAKLPGQEVDQAEPVFLPLETARGTAGVLAIRPEPAVEPDSLESWQLLMGLGRQAALALERTSLAEEARQAQLLQVTEKLQSALLDSISHELRTPLVSITGTLGALLDEGEALKEPARSRLVEDAYQEAQRLNRLVGNLLGMSRLEAGVHLELEPHDLQDLVGVALEQLAERLKDRALEVDIPPDLPLVVLDFIMMVQVLVNLLDNSLKHTDPSSLVEIRAWQLGEQLALQVADRGPGVPAEELPRIFEKFYRVIRLESAGGTGLGLTISRGIVEAHGGSINAENREGGGMAVTITLPLTPPEPPKSSVVGPLIPHGISTHGLAAPSE